jgi:hypothetical protein
MKDGVGNDLQLNDLVALSLERPLIFGSIESIQLGGIITGIKGRDAQMQMTKVVIISKHTIDVDPRSPFLGAVLKLHDPALPTQVRPEQPPPDEAETKPN